MISRGEFDAVFSKGGRFDYRIDRHPGDPLARLLLMDRKTEGRYEMIVHPQEDIRCSIDKGITELLEREQEYYSKHWYCARPPQYGPKQAEKSITNKLDIKLLLIN